MSTKKKYLTGNTIPFIAAALILFGSVSVVSAQSEWNPASSPGQFSWNDAANWSVGGIPNANGTTATFSTTNSNETRIVADTAAASTIRFGNMNITDNRSYFFGRVTGTDLPDLGSFRINNNGNTSVFDLGSELQNGRGFVFEPTKADQFVLENNLLVRQNGGNVGIIQFRAGNAANAFNGGGHTLTLEGNTRVNIGQSGFNANPIKDLTLDVRGSTHTGGHAQDEVINFSGSWAVPTTADSGVKIIAGNSDQLAERQRIHLNARGSFGLDIEMHGVVNLHNRNSSSYAIQSTISDGTGSTAANNRLWLTIDGTSSTETYTMAGSAANTYSGGTLVDMTGATLALSKAGALGTGDVTIDNLGVLDINVDNAFADNIHFTLNSAETVINTGGFNRILSGWTIDGFDLAAGDYTAASGTINGFDFGAQFNEGATWTVIPEPSTLILVGLFGFSALYTARRKSRR